MDISAFPGSRYVLGGIFLFSVIAFAFLFAGFAHVFLVEDSNAGGRALLGTRSMRRWVRNFTQYYSVRLFLSGLLGLFVVVAVSVPITLEAGSAADHEEIERRITSYVLDLRETADEGALRQHVFWGVEDAELAHARQVVQDGNYTLTAIEVVELTYDRARVRVQLTGDGGRSREEIFDCQREPDGWRLRSTGFLD